MKPNTAGAMDSSAVVFIVLACIAFLQSSSKASVTVVQNEQVIHLSAVWNGKMIERGVVHQSDPTVLIDEHERFLNAVINAFVPQNTSRLFKAGINTASLVFYQASIHPTWELYSADTDVKLISWHTFRANLLPAQISSRCKALFGKPYRLLSAFRAAQLKHQIIIEDIYDGDLAEQDSLTEQTYYELIQNSLDLTSNPLFIRHYYYGENDDHTNLLRDASECKNHLLHFTTIVLTSPQHSFIVSSPSIESCATVTRSLGMPESSFTCLDVV